MAGPLGCNNHRSDEQKAHEDILLQRRFGLSKVACILTKATFRQWPEQTQRVNGKERRPGIPLEAVHRTQVVSGCSGETDH